MKYTVLVGDKTYIVEIGADNRIFLDGTPHEVDFKGIDGGSLYSLLVDNTSWELLAEPNRDEYRISLEGELHVVTVMDERTGKMAKALGKAAISAGDVTLKAPMPGLVRQMMVSVDQEVTAGQGLVILEAMKMENELRAPRGGTIKELLVKAGEKVEHGQALVVIK